MQALKLLGNFERALDDRLAVAGWLTVLCVLALRYSVLFSATAALSG